MSSLAMVPNFVKAANENELVRAMLAKNIRDGITYKYFDIGIQGDTWFAWYLADTSKLLKGALNDKL